MIIFVICDDVTRNDGVDYKLQKKRGHTHKLWQNEIFKSFTLDIEKRVEMTAVNTERAYAWGMKQNQKKQHKNETKKTNK